MAERSPRAAVALVLLLAGCAAPTRPAKLRDEAAAAGATRPNASRGTDPFAGTTKRAQWVMGTRLSIAVAVETTRDAEPLLREAFALAQQLETLLSHYRADSALGQLNARSVVSARVVEADVDPRLFGFLQRSQRYSRATRGAFDLTAGPLIALYARARGPEPDALAKARRAVGYERLVVVAPRRVRLPPGTRLDPGGIGKGYAIDTIVALLRRRGVVRAFIDFGGSGFFGMGAPGWPVLVRSARFDRHHGTVVLRDEGLSSSLSRPFTADGGLDRPHIVDPRSGRLVSEPRLAAVVAPSATDAEVLSTALIVEPTLVATLLDRFPAALTLTETAGAAPNVDPRLRLRLQALSSKRAP